MMNLAPQGHGLDHSVTLNRSAPDDTYSDSCLVIERRRYFASINGVPLRLTKTEFRILSSLASNVGGVTHLDDLWRSAWGSHKPVNRKSIQVMMSRVRRKLAPRGIRIDSLVDVGYILSHDKCCR